jgi:hypothetical protein
LLLESSPNRFGKRCILARFSETLVAVATLNVCNGRFCARPTGNTCSLQSRLKKYSPRATFPLPAAFDVIMTIDKFNLKVSPWIAF